MPGRSKRMTGRRGSRASTKGWSSSRLTPMPLQSRIGGQPLAPSRTETRRLREPTARIRIRSGLGFGFRSALRRRSGSVVIDIGPRCVADRPQPATAQFGGRGLLVAAALGQPGRVVQPPGARAGLGGAEPFLGVFRAVRSELVPGFLVAGRID